MCILVCPDPPVGANVFSSISFTHVQSEFWSYTVLKYQCEPDHEFKWGENNTRVCGSDGYWNYNVAPVCVPGKLTNKLRYK